MNTIRKERVKLLVVSGVYKYSSIDARQCLDKIIIMFSKYWAAQYAIFPSDTLEILLKIGVNVDNKPNFMSN
jgi:hypothetical protein